MFRTLTKKLSHRKKISYKQSSRCLRWFKRKWCGKCQERAYGRNNRFQHTRIQLYVVRLKGFSMLRHMQVCEIFNFLVGFAPISCEPFAMKLLHCSPGNGLNIWDAHWNIYVNVLRLPFELLKIYDSFSVEIPRHIYNWCAHWAFMLIVVQCGYEFEFKEEIFLWKGAVLYFFVPSL